MNKPRANKNGSMESMLWRNNGSRSMYHYQVRQGIKMAETKIQWTDHSENPIRSRLKSEPTKVGHYCEKVNSGCTNCYASSLQKRFQMPEFGSGQHADKVEHFLCEKTLERIRKRKKPTKYFLGDMTDLFGDWVKPEWIHAILDTIDSCQHHTFQLLTKRPENIRRNWKRLGFECPHYGTELINYRDNVWLGASGANQETANVAWLDLQSSIELCKFTFMSLEPLVGPIDLDEMWRNSAMPSWIIVGGESGPRARPCNIEWIRSIVNQCKEAGVPCFVKQLGAWALSGNCIFCDRSSGKMPTGDNCPQCSGSGKNQLFIQDRKGGDLVEWPDDLRVRSFPGSEVSCDN